MQQAHPPTPAGVAATPAAEFAAARRKRGAWAATPKPLPVLRCVVQDSSLPSEYPGADEASSPSSRFDGVGAGRPISAKVSSALRGWVSRALFIHQRRARLLWGDEAPAKLEEAVADLRECLHSQGIDGLAQALASCDPLEKQVLLLHLAPALSPSSAQRQQVLGLAASLAAAEQPVLAFLENTVDVFKGFDAELPGGAGLLRQAVNEIGGAAAAPEPGIKASALAQVLLRQFGGAHFDGAVRLLRLGIRADLKSRHASPLGPRLLAAATDRSVFCAVKLTHRVSNDLCRRLAQLGVQGHCAATDLACALLAGADSGCGEPGYLLSRYLGPETAASIRANRQALESFRAAFAVLPISLWPPSRAHGRDLLLANMGRAHATHPHATLRAA